MKALILAIATCLSTASALAWPTKTITLVVPYTPGTGIDLIARQLSNHLPDALKQPVVVENLPGASGNIGSAKVARANPDGHTLMVQVNTLVMNKGLYKQLSYDPVNDFTPVTLTSWGTLVLTTHTKVQSASSVSEVVAAAKSKAGHLTYGTPGAGTPHHLAMALFLQRSDTEMLHIPFKGTAGALTDLLAGRVDYMFLPVHVALKHIHTGQLKAIATGSSKRLPQLPDVPTLAESGVGTDNVDMWYGIFAPKGTPADVVARLNLEISRILKQPGIANAFESQGMVPATSTPAEFAALVNKDAQRWADVVKKGSITPD